MIAMTLWEGDRKYKKVIKNGGKKEGNTKKVLLQGGKKEGNAKRYYKKEDEVPNNIVKEAVNIEKELY